MVRNPFRPWWIHVWRNTSFDSFIEAFAAEIAGSGLGMETRILWAARHACKQLRAERDAAIEEGLQVVEALLGEPTPLPDSYYSVAVTVRELRMRLAKSEAESAEFRAHAWGEQEKLRGRLADVERELAIERATLNDANASTERAITIAKSMERERDETHRVLRDCLHALGNGSAIAEMASHESHCFVPSEVAAACATMRAELATAQQENTRLRDTLKQLADCIAGEQRARMAAMPGMPRVRVRG